MEMDTDISPQKVSVEERERMVRSYAVWLDRALDDEQPPEGLTAELISALRNGDPLPPLEGAERGGDLYALWGAMTALSQEVRVQGRLFKQLNETLVQHHQASAPEAGEAEEPRSGPVGAAQPRKQEIDLLLDLRDRVERGIATLRHAATELALARLPLLARWLGLGTTYARHVQEILDAISHGYTLTLDRLNEALVACGVDRIVCLNCLFDPQRMTAVDIAETGDIPEGTVVEVYREGYEWNGKVYRTAQVKVARNTRS
jgi:molecular chaperone GrpE